MSSTFQILKKKASQYLRREEPSGQQSAERDSMVSADCMGRINHLVRLNSRKVRDEPQFEIVPDSPPPQLPEIGHLGEKKGLKRSKSMAVMPILTDASQDGTSAVVDMFNLVSLRSIQSSTIRIPGAYPSSSSASERPSSNYSVSPPPSPFGTWLTFDEKLNRSSETVILHAADHLRSVSQLADNNSIYTPSAGAESNWATTSTGSSGQETPTPSPRPKSSKGKGRAFPGGYYPSTAVQQPYGLIYAASETDSIKTLPPQKQLRHQSNLLFQNRQVRLDQENDTIPEALPEQVPRRRSSDYNLPSTTPKSKLQWGDLSSDCSSENSEDLRQLRKDLKLPSQRIATPNLSSLRRRDEVVEGPSQQPSEEAGDDPFFHSSHVRDLTFANHEQNYVDEAQATDAFFQPPTGFFPADTAIIANLRSAVQRVETEMSRLRFENNQMLHDIEAANNRAVFWQERNVGLEEEVSLKQRELEDLRERALEAGLQVPERWQEEESQVEQNPEEQREHEDAIIDDDDDDDDFS